MGAATKGHVKVTPETGTPVAPFVGKIRAEDPMVVVIGWVVVGVGLTIVNAAEVTWVVSCEV